MNNEQQARAAYVQDKMRLLKEADKIRKQINELRQALIANESKQWRMQDEFLEYRDGVGTTDHWHPVTEAPEHDQDGWFLAVAENGLPFITHYMGTWISQVKMWKYIDLPTNIL